MPVTGWDMDKEQTQRRIADALERQNELRGKHNELLGEQNELLQRLAAAVEFSINRRLGG